MLVPVGAAFGAFARTTEFRAITAAPTALAVAVTTRPIEFGTILPRAIEFRSLAERAVAGCAIVARPRDARTVLAAFALLPGLVFTAVTAAEILARTFAKILARRPIAARSRVALLPGL